MSLPNDYAARKAIPLFDFLTKYFPDALVEVTKVAVEGNKQHNPGEPLHWARGKSMDQLNTAMRHLFDHGAGNTRDTDGCMHLAKTAWRVLAELQLIVEREALETRHGLPEGTAAELEAKGISLTDPPEVHCCPLWQSHHEPTCPLFIGDREAPVVDSGLPGHHARTTEHL